jgi:hypothetical protein
LSIGWTLAVPIVEEPAGGLAKRAAGFTLHVDESAVLEAEADAQAGLR